MENFDSNGCAHGARGQEKALHRQLCGAAHWGGDLRVEEKVREGAGVAGEARARRISRPGYSTGLFEQQVPVKSVFAQTEIEHTGQKETALWASWGAHRERVEADAWAALWSGREGDE